jgi:hypothetical protein
MDDSRTGYSHLGKTWNVSTGSKENREWVFSATCTVLLYLSVTVLAVFSYNPLAVSFASAFGGVLAISSVLIVESLVNKQTATFELPNPWLAMVFWTIFQVTASIAYHYNPMNHGEISTLFSLALLPGVVFSKAHKGKYIPVLVALGGYGFTIYRAAHVWMGMSVLYATVAVVALVVLLRIPRDKRCTKDLAIIAVGNLVLNAGIVGTFCLLKIYPLDDEIVLIVYCSVAGAVAGLAVYLQVTHAQNKITSIGYALIGMMQVFSEGLVFWMTLFGHLFLPVLPVFLGVEACLIISLWEKKENKKNSD